MTPQESQRLLTLLSSSFKQQLDHNRSSDLEDHADLHLRSIVTNPLFATRSSAKCDAVLSSTLRGRSDKSMGLIQEFVKRPVDLFREHVSAGTATMRTATLCLQAEYRNRLASIATTTGAALRSSNAATTMLDWLWASSNEDLGTLLEQQIFFKTLVPFLVAGKRVDRIWSWLKTMQSSLDSVPPHISHSSIAHAYQEILAAFIKAQVSVGDGVDAATATFGRAANKWPQRWERSLRSSAWFLTKLLMRQQNSPNSRHTTIRSLMQATGTLSKPITLLSACHWVHLAETPDLAVPLKYLRSLQPAKISSHVQPTIILMALKAAELLLEKGHESDALWTVNFLQKNFKDEVEGSAPLKRDHLWQKGSNQLEEGSLRLLGALAIH